MLHQDGIYAEPVKIFPLAIHLAVLTIFIFGLSLLGGFNFWETMIFSIMGYIFLNLGYFIFKRTGIEIMDKFPFRQIRIISLIIFWIWIFFKYGPKYFPSFPDLKINLDWLWYGISLFLALFLVIITDLPHFYFNGWKNKLVRLGSALKEEEIYCPFCGATSFEPFRECHPLGVCDNPFPGHVSLQSMQRRCKGCGEIF